MTTEHKTETDQIRVVLDNHWFHAGDTCECGYWAELDSVKRHHIEDKLVDALSAPASTPEERVLELVEGDAALIRMSRNDALRRAADALEAQPPKLKAQYVAALRLYAEEPERLGLAVAGNPICSERGIPQSECPPFCPHDFGRLEAYVAKYVNDSPAALRVRLVEAQHNALEMARKADQAERRAEEAEFHVEQLRDALDSAERRIERAERHHHDVVTSPGACHCDRTESALVECPVHPSEIPSPPATTGDLAAAFERDRQSRDRTHTCLTSAGSPVCPACREERQR